MAVIPTPVAKSIISSSQWGIPITDQVNANTTAIAALQPGVWNPISYLNGYYNLGSGWQIGQLRKRGDMVDLRGVVVIGTMGAAMFQLPVGYRPPSGLQVACDGFNGAGNYHVSMQIPATGAPTIGSAASPQVTSVHFCFSFSTV